METGGDRCQTGMHGSVQNMTKQLPGVTHLSCPSEFTLRFD